jgi:UPF0755 protein
MSRPGGPGGPDRPDGPDKGDELPWPQSEPPSDPPPAGSAGEWDPGDVVEPDETDGAPRADRRAARAGRSRRRRRILLSVGGVLVVIVLAFVLWYEIEAHALGGQGPQVVVTVHQGESTSAIIDSLNEKHVIGSSIAFKFFDVFHGTPTVLPGSYSMHQNQTFSAVRADLAAGPNIYPVEVRPGFTLSEVAQQVDGIPGHDAGGFSKEAASGAVHSTFSPPGSNDLEGMLGTGEYLVLPGESDLTIVQDMVQRFDHDATAEGLSTASAAAVGLTTYEVITAASIVEKEGYIPVNMPDTARVIYNRLAKNLPLQMDSTVLYALGQDGGPVTQHDLQIQSPYNSYLNDGLTPTPICMPSKNAMNAALHPPPGNWLYFVLVQKNGVMAFSDTYAQQLANQQLAKSRGLP